MIDEIYDRHYHAARANLNASIAQAVSHLASTVRDAFEVLVRIEYSAPWAAKTKRARIH